MKKILFLLFIIFIFSTNIIFANQYDNNFKLRIGIFFGTNAKDMYTITGENLFINIFGEEIWNTRSNKVVVSKSNGIYISKEKYSTYEEASIYSDEVYFNNGYFYPVMLFGEYILGNNIKITSEDGKSLIILGDKNQYIGSRDDIVSINGTKYREHASVYNDGKKIIAINIIGLDNYLKGVVPKEMPSTWHIEALKAQSVVARNFAITNINKHIKEGFNLCNTINCQVYGGISAETKNTNLAVDLTSGKVMYYGNDLVEGYFHSSSGGRTESSENIWTNAIPYLVGVEDHYSIGNVYDNWHVSMTSLEMRLQLEKNGIFVGDIQNIIPIYSENGRIIELTINGNVSSFTLRKDRIRTVLGSSKLKSTYFTITSSNTKIENRVLQEYQFIRSNNLNDIYKNLELIIDNNRNENNVFVSGTNFIINGKGYGHGVGMSQFGAGNMAKEGFRYDEILKHYFKGIEII